MIGGEGTQEKGDQGVSVHYQKKHIGDEALEGQVVRRSKSKSLFPEGSEVISESLAYGKAK